MADREERREGIGLCLSGGGFRAALFHLGALRRLQELGILARVRTISSVSGGSILAAFLADRLAAARRPIAAACADWTTAVAQPVRAFCSRDLRTVPVLAHLLWNWVAPGPRVRHMQRRYYARLTQLSLGNLPAHPQFILCASDLTFGVNWEFRAAEVGDYQAGHLERRDWPLALAVAASASFPPVFGPLRIREAASDYREGAYAGPDRDRLRSRIDLSDGGVYDNLGLEPVWKGHECVLVSDCGAPFDFKVGDTPWSRLLRYTAVLTSQTRALRLRHLFADWDAHRYRGAYWTHTNWARSPGDGYGEKITLEVLANVRTDLDNFSDAEMSVLENHGYFAADRKIRLYAPTLLPANAPPPRAPYPEWMDEGRVRRALRHSHRRVDPGRLWASWKAALARWLT